MSTSNQHRPEPAGRLAPSPTGAQHLGNARTYLLAWLSIRARGGTVVLRVEDIDSPRIKKDADRQAIEDLRWLGLDWDEGPDRGGLAGPYVQTQQQKTKKTKHKKQQTTKKNKPNTKTHTNKTKTTNTPHNKQKPPHYPGTC